MPSLLTKSLGFGPLLVFLLSPTEARSQTLASSSGDVPRVFAPTRPIESPALYPWRRNIRASVFWVGEQPTPNNPTPNCKSSWDTRWMENFGGYDNPSPSARVGYRPRAFVPRVNPFYVALPYNDVINHRAHKPEAERVIPWFHREFREPGRSVCHGRWIAIRKGNRIAYAQWEDCGPFNTIDWEYVFGGQRPREEANNRPAIDLSPAVRDYLGMGGLGTVDWRFVELSEVPPGPWRQWGSNNPFVQSRQREAEVMSNRSRAARESGGVWVRDRPTGSR